MADNNQIKIGPGGNRPEPLIPDNQDLKESVHKATDQAIDFVDESVGKARRMAAQAKDSTREKAAQARDWAADQGDKVKQWTEEKSDRTKSMLAEGADKIKDLTAEAAGKIRNWADKDKDRIG